MTSAAPHPLQPVLELAVLFPAAFLCFLATADHLRLKARALALIVVPALTLVCLLGGWLCWRMRWPVATVLLPLLAVLAAAFCRAVALPVWKSASVFLGVCGVWSSLSCLAVIANARYRNTGPKYPLNPGGVRRCRPFPNGDRQNGCLWHTSY